MIKIHPQKFILNGRLGETSAAPGKQWANRVRDRQTYAEIAKTAQNSLI